MTHMDIIEPADFKTFWNALSADDKARLAAAAMTTVGNIDSHWKHARKIPNPTRMERLYVACAQFGAPFTKSQLVAFFYETNKDRAIKSSVADREAASDDAQPPAGTSVRKSTKQQRVPERVA